MDIPDSPVSPISPESKKLYNEAMRTGYVDCRIIKTLIIGAAGVGKTTIKHLLLNRELPMRRESTGIMNHPVRAVSVSRIGVEQSSWFAVDNDDELMNMIADVVKDRIVPEDDALGASTECSAVTSDERNDRSSIHNKFIDAINEATGKLKLVGYHSKFRLVT